MIALENDKLKLLDELGVERTRAHMFEAQIEIKDAEVRKMLDQLKK